MLNKILLYSNKTPSSPDYYNASSWAAERWDLGLLRKECVLATRMRHYTTNNSCLPPRAAARRGAVCPCVDARGTLPCALGR